MGGIWHAIIGQFNVYSFLINSRMNPWWFVWQIISWTMIITDTAIVLNWYCSCVEKILQLCWKETAVARNRGHLSVQHNCSIRSTQLQYLFNTTAVPDEWHGLCSAQLQFIFNTTAVSFQHNYNILSTQL